MLSRQCHGQLFGLQRTMGWTIDVEMLYLARKKAMLVVEPVECHCDETSEMPTLPAAHLTPALVSELDRRLGPQKNATDAATRQ